MILCGWGDLRATLAQFARETVAHIVVQLTLHGEGCEMDGSFWGWMRLLGVLSMHTCTLIMDRHLIINFLVMQYRVIFLNY